MNNHSPDAYTVDCAREDAESETDPESRAVALGFPDAEAHRDYIRSLHDALRDSHHDRQSAFRG